MGRILNSMRISGIVKVISTPGEIFLFGNQEDRSNSDGFSGKSGFNQQQRGFGQLQSGFNQQERELDQQGSRFDQQKSQGSSFQRFNNEDEDMTYDLQTKNHGRDIDSMGSDGNGGFGNAPKGDSRDDNDKDGSSLGPMFVIGQTNSNNAKSRRW